MQKTRNRFGLAALALFLVALFAFAMMATRAEAANWWNDDVKDSLTVQAIYEGEGNQAMAEDLATANLAIDVYQIADASANDQTQSFDYVLREGFAGLELKADMKADDWQKLAEGALDAVWPLAEGEGAQGRMDQKKPDRSVMAGQKIEGLDNGLYLVVPHGVEASDLSARADAARYAFSPTVVALPTKAGDATGQTGTADSFGNWLSDVTVYLKPEQSPLYGSLNVNKVVSGFSGEPATFVFHVVDKATGGRVYDNYASVYFTGGTEAQATLTRIPAALEVTVEEVYSGARYTSLTGPQDAKIVSDEAVEAGEGEVPAASVTFENEANDSGLSGHGINNNFELQESGEWAWTQTPQAPAAEE